MFKKILQMFVVISLLIPLNSYAGNPILATQYHVPPLPPNDEPPAPVCCSSVLFLPGFEGSRLYRNEQTTTGISEPNMLWEPSENDDIRKMSLKEPLSKSDILDTDNMFIRKFRYIIYQQKRKSVW